MLSVCASCVGRAVGSGEFEQTTTTTPLPTDFCCCSRFCSHCIAPLTATCTCTCALSLLLSLQAGRAGWRRARRAGAGSKGHQSTNLYTDSSVIRLRFDCWARLPEFRRGRALRGSQRHRRCAVCAQAGHGLPTVGARERDQVVGVNKQKFV